MTRAEFFNYVKGEVSERFPDCEVALQTIIKNNVSKEGLQVLRGQVAPVVYLEGFFEEYQNGAELDELLKSIFSVTESSLRNSDSIMDMSDAAIADWRNRVFASLVKGTDNDEYLDKVVSRRYLDMAIIYRLPLTEEMTTVITAPLLEQLGCDEDEVYEVAMRNANDMSIEVKSMADTLSSLMGIDPEELPPSLMPPMWVVSGGLGFPYGASVILADGALEKILNEVDAEDVYLLPSSIAEWIVVPSACAEAEKLLECVKEVNTTEVPPEDILSYSVYHYQRNGQLSVIQKIAA